MGGLSGVYAHSHPHRPQGPIGPLPLTSLRGAGLLVLGGLLLKQNHGQEDRSRWHSCTPPAVSPPLQPGERITPGRYKGFYVVEFLKVGAHLGQHANPL